MASNTKIIATVSAKNGNDSYTTNLYSANHQVIADEPQAIGGKDEGPSPADYLCMSLASCKAITLRMYIQRKKWNIELIHVKVALQRHETDGEVSHTFYADITVDDRAPAEQKERLVHIAKACPVSKLLGHQNQIVTNII